MYIASTSLFEKLQKVSLNGEVLKLTDALVCAIARPDTHGRFPLAAIDSHRVRATTRMRRDHRCAAPGAECERDLATLERDLAARSSPVGPPPIPFEKLVRAMQVQACYSNRSDGLLIERLEYDLLFRWSVSGSVTRPLRYSQRRRLAGT
ncbi:transposase [Mesorhizobium sp. P15089B]|nr:hypothetical protein X736_31770 [Mesorhizobium sp. L2C089B000]